ncbi:hypothetical protein BCA_1087 [Bacillus cereus 03BB102]|uniref:Uncharacterized protein n=1 Tax=Bacillus cereus (strain 03BB102) TaxID=572264 RepID=A0A158RQD0_BACC3|nr:hypothetical protein BCA_1087 [Bacillus cereus 03BB102]
MDKLKKNNIIFSIILAITVLAIGLTLSIIYNKILQKKKLLQLP